MAVYTNRVYDAVASGFVRWDTGTPDTAGGSYPGPDAFGNTFDFTIEAVKQAGGTNDHSSLINLGLDTHTQYPLLLGRAGGQTLIGGTGVGDDLVLQSSSNGTPGDIVLNNQLDANSQNFIGVADITSAGSYTTTAGRVTATAASGHAAEFINVGGDVAAVLRVTSTTGGNPGTADIFVGDRDPNSVVDAVEGSLYIRADVGSSSVYVKNTASGTLTGWLQFSSGGVSSLQTAYDVSGAVALDVDGGNDLAFDSATPDTSGIGLFSIRRNIGGGEQTVLKAPDQLDDTVDTGTDLVLSSGQGSEITQFAQDGSAGGIVYVLSGAGGKGIDSPGEGPPYDGGPGGAIEIVTGAGGAGGANLLTVDDAGDAGTSGNLTIKTGDAVNGAAGSAVAVAGAGGSTGQVTLAAGVGGNGGADGGAGGGVGGSGGIITIYGGNGGDGTGDADGGDGGTILLKSGDGGVSAGSGYTGTLGHVDIEIGDSGDDTVYVLSLNSQTALTYMYVGTQNPNTVIDAATGSVYFRIADGSSTIYVNTSVISGNTWTNVAAGGGGGTDELVSVSANDTTPGYLLGKLTSTGSIAFTEVNDGADEDLRLDVVFGTTTGTVTQGDDTRIPSQDENDALVGTNGTPSAANPFVTDSDPRLAGGGLTVAAQQTANYAAAVSELVPYDPSGGSFTITLPTGAAEGAQIIVKNDTIDSTEITVDTAGAETIDGAATFALNLSRQAVTFIYDGVSAWRAI